MKHDILRAICPGPVIPAARTYEDFQWALAKGQAPGIIVLFADLVSLPGLLAEAKSHGKHLIVHLDLFEGVGKDKIGIKYLARTGVAALITTKSPLVRAAKDEGMIVVQRLFLMDSESLKNASKLAKNLSPDALEVMPASVPEWVFKQLAGETGLPILAGGLIRSREEVESTLARGATAVSTSCKLLWQ